MTALHQRLTVEAPYVQAVRAFEQRLGLERGTATGSCALELAAPLAEGRHVVATTTRLPGSGNYTSRYGIAWDAGQAARGIPTPGFEGTLIIRAGEDYDTCELELDGSYAPPGGIAGKLFDDVAGSRIAHATLGAMLDGVRDELRDSHERTEAAKQRV